MTLDELTVDTWYQLAVIRVFGSWLDPEASSAMADRQYLSGLVRHARLMLALRQVEDPALRQVEPPSAAFPQLNAWKGTST
ncbi:hypothetical protein ETD83_40955 [Actinomadura soli]|uniref:Uncharacterized protein n=1 Tax=Actinomadura soli TaxID=2508997 RepID=A0A5C4IYA9_9ACTN|nr:hypothetical protein [Actinomadura soli]TMQ84017.1 hypothetical protein ETD83_40955 [Actinomadura soli]